jgi:glycosyltransferase involved in cell wall biosynthesis
MQNNRKVLFLVPYPLHRAPSQRFRVELFLPLLQERQIPYRVEPFLDETTWGVLYSNASAIKKGIGVIKGFLRRVYVLFFVLPWYEYVFVHREASPVGPPIFEFFISKLWRKKLIYDFDDAIWIPNTSKENKIVSWLKAFWKVKYICRWSYKVVGGNAFLCAYARRYNANVLLIPTCVDADRQHNRLKEQQTPNVVVGWTGSHSTMGYLKSIVPVLQAVAEEQKIAIVIISNKPPPFSLPRLQFISWKEATEIEDLLQLNIGVMPLEEDAWCEGKCGFKLIQYLAMGIPAVASPVGVNRQIIEQGKNGFLCKSEQEWHTALTTLIKDDVLRTEMGKAGRARVVQQYSVQANAAAFVSLFAPE